MIKSHSCLFRVLSSFS